MSRVVSVRQPWAWAITRAGKDMENRTWPSRYRGELYIHAGTRIEYAAVDLMAGLAGRVPPAELATGGLVGRVRLVEVHHAEDCLASCSPWAEEGCWHWVLADRRPLPQFVPCRGRLGLFQPPELDDMAATRPGVNRRRAA